VLGLGIRNRCFGNNMDFVVHLFQMPPGSAGGRVQPFAIARHQHCLNAHQLPPSATPFDPGLQVLAWDYIEDAQ
jgi:hypothetical protein